MENSMSTEAQTPTTRNSNFVRIAGIILAALALIAAGVLIGWFISARTVPANYGYGWMMRGGAAPFQTDPQYAYGPGMMGGRGMMGGWNGGPDYGRGGMMGGYGYGPGMMGGWGEGYGPMAEYHDLMVETLAGELGLTADELQAEFEAGKTIWQIAEAQGLSDEELLAAMSAAREVMVNQALEDGAITQEQADWMLSHDIGQCPGWGGWDDADDQ